MNNLRSFALFILVLLTLLDCRAATSDALPPPVVPQCVGVNIHFTGSPKRDLDGLAAGGVGWVRMDFVWETVEKVKGRYDFSAYDALYAGLSARQIKPLFILDYGNSLYQDGSPRSPEAQAAFARFAAAAAIHYRGKPILWEIWNEPNGTFWKPQANVTEYGQLALTTARAIKEADPHATVLAPGTSGIPLDFLESVFQTGVLRYLDAVSVHPYRGDAPETAAAEFQAVRRLIHKYAPPGKTIPLVSSEWGYSTVNVPEEQQAQWLAREWLSNLAEGVRLSIWYDWHEDGINPKDPEHHFGTVRFDYTPKPAFLAAQTLTQALGGYRFVKRLSLPSEKDYVLLFTRGSSLKLAVWTMGEEHEITLPGGRQLTLSPAPLYVNGGSDPALRAAASWTVIPKDEFSSAGTPVKLTLAYQNRDRRPHRIRFPVQVILPNQATATTAGLVVAGQTRTWEVTLPSRERLVLTAQVGLELDGKQQPYEQQIRITPTDPLSLSLAPLAENRFQVQIANPGATAFSGRLSVTGSGHTATLPARLRAGQTTLTLAIPGTPGMASFGTLRDSQGLLVSQTPTLRFVPYAADFSALQMVLDGDLKAPSTVRAVPAPDATASNPALQVQYQFAPGWSFWRAADPKQTVLPGHPTGIGMWVQGDGSGNAVRARLRDATGQAFQLAAPDMTWIGWRFVSFTLVTPPGKPSQIGYWGGANDGKPHYPLTMDTLFLLDSRESAKAHQGTMEIKQPVLVYEGAAP